MCLQSPVAGVMVAAGTEWVSVLVPAPAIRHHRHHRMQSFPSWPVQPRPRQTNVADSSLLPLVAAHAAHGASCTRGSVTEVLSRTVGDSTRPRKKGPRDAALVVRNWSESDQVARGGAAISRLRHATRHDRRRLRHAWCSDWRTRSWRNAHRTRLYARRTRSDRRRRDMWDRLRGGWWNFDQPERQPNQRCSQDMKCFHLVSCRRRGAGARRKGQRA